MMSPAEALARRLVANLGHEIRTPMTAVLGMTELVLETRLEPEQRRWLESAKQAGESLLGILDDLLDFSKIEAGTIALRTVSFDIRTELTDVLGELATLARRKGLAFRSVVAHDVRDRVTGDPERWRQIISNLVSNAIKFTATGEVMVEVRQTSPTAITTIVRDTGIGISAEQQVAIFAAFAQADASTTRSQGGTGLGLTIAARLAELMAGEITLRSAVNQGSEFACTVQLGMPAEAIASSPPRSLRVLVAEDNELSAQLIQELLTRRGHVARIARTGVEALEMLGDDDLLLLDLHMPGLDGFEVIARIRARERATGGHLAVIALTASSRQGDRERCLEAGMDDFIAKPINANALGATIARLATLRPVWFDADVLLAACDGEASIYENIRRALQTAVPDELAIAVGQLARGEMVELRKTAHRLHGLIGAVSSTVGAVASELEDQAELGSVPDARALVATLQAQVPGLLAELVGTPFESLSRWSA